MNAKQYGVVIACGGLGTRLQNITKEIPKPLYPINGISTLERCIDQLSLLSFDNILVTIGFRSSIFENFIKKLNTKYNFNIDIFLEKQPLGECGALWQVQENLSENFIFINGDLIFSIDFDRLISFHKRLSSNLTLVTHTSDHPKDSDLVSASNGTLVDQIYLKKKTKDSFPNAYLGNSGIFVINKNLLRKIQAPVVKEIKSVFHHIVKNIFDLNINVYSYNTTEYIKDMGTPSRLKIVEQDLQKNKVNLRNYKNKQKALFLDRDNTLISCEIGTYIVDINDIKFIDKNINKIAELSKAYNLVCLVTNQPGIAMGKISIKELEIINSFIIKYCLSKGLKIDVVSFCPHHPHQGFEGEIKVLKRDCFCRKPNPGLILEQAFSRNINLQDSLMIGDSDCDFQAAEKSGCNFIHVNNL